MRTRAFRTVAAIVLAASLSGCGLFGVKGAGLDKGTPSSLDPHCTAPPFELPAGCVLAGIGADTRTFNDSHAFVGSKIVIAGTTNYLDVMTSMGRVISFQEQFHADPPLNDHEARIVAHGEVPYDGKKLFTKKVAGMCEIVEYKSARLRKMYGKAFSAVLLVLRSADPSAFDKTNVSIATISLTAPHSRSSIKSC